MKPKVHEYVLAAALVAAVPALTRAMRLVSEPSDASVAAGAVVAAVTIATILVSAYLTLKGRNLL